MENVSFPSLHIQSVFSSLPVRSQLCVPVLCGSSKRCPQSICPAGDHHGGSAEAEPCPHPRPPPNTCVPSARPALPTGLPAGTMPLHSHGGRSCNLICKNMSVNRSIVILGLHSSSCSELVRIGALFIYSWMMDLANITVQLRRTPVMFISHTEMSSSFLSMLLTQNL